MSDKGGWQYGGPPENMAPGQVMERHGSVGGGVVVETTSVPNPTGGEMKVTKTTENGIETTHTTIHPDGTVHNHPKT